MNVQNKFIYLLSKDLKQTKKNMVLNSGHNLSTPTLKPSSQGPWEWLAPLINGICVALRVCGDGVTSLFLGACITWGLNPSVIVGALCFCAHTKPLLACH